MGYYTKYKIKAVDENGSFIKKKKFFNDLKLYNGEASWEKDSNNAFSLFDGEETKWYEHDDDLLLASEQHPTTTFILSGEGEDNGDVWAKFYKNGVFLVWRPEIIEPTLSMEITACLEGKSPVIPRSFVLGKKD